MIYATGKFRAQALEGSLGYSTTGKEEIAVQFLILEGPDEGKRITWWGYLSDAAADRTLESLLHTGWDGEDVSVLTGLGSKDATIVIQEDTYKGVKRTKVAWVNQLSRGPTNDKAMDDSQRTSFAERMRGRTIALQKKVPAQVGPAADLASAQVAGDDIPF
jgi:hypothetical protein